ncbi:MAG: hypothetical protein LBR38_07330 [Synergistaceae bacterium]|jgi:hypothetical protein|nr:hypothetical protein [Synergistaceae bacterium]
MTVGEGITFAGKAAETLAGWGVTPGEIVLLAAIVLLSAAQMLYTRHLVKTEVAKLRAEIADVERRMSAGIMKLAHALRAKKVLDEADVVCVQAAMK